MRLQERENMDMGTYNILRVNGLLEKPQSALDVLCQKVAELIYDNMARRVGLFSPISNWRK